MYQHIKVPADGKKITVNADFSLTVPDNPVIPYIEGDGTGVDISPVMIKVIDAAVAKAYGGKRKISWMEIYAGEKSTQVYGLRLAIFHWNLIRCCRVNGARYHRRRCDDFAARMDTKCKRPMSGAFLRQNAYFLSQGIAS